MQKAGSRWLATPLEEPRQLDPSIFTHHCSTEKVTFACGLVHLPEHLRVAGPLQLIPAALSTIVHRIQRLPTSQN
jgi:hypothetical protein